MKKSPAYYRARIAAIEENIQTIAADRDEKNNDRVVFRYGVFPTGYDEATIVAEKLTEKSFSDEPLTFEEQTRFNTWFAMHPEKVAGLEQITTSREFPIGIKGSKEDILRTIKGKETDFAFALQLQKKRATAKLKMLSL
ncbi:MAG: hypothetical protein KKA07_06625 [Bacteroidetes bacterium]|nr:hypothetical protein [Bacteroidota bacterium]MBU1718731.1 hypothetical protein [Bacteroidota bacterium]